MVVPISRGAGKDGMGYKTYLWHLLEVTISDAMPCLTLGSITLHQTIQQENNIYQQEARISHIGLFFIWLDLHIIEWPFNCIQYLSLPFYSALKVLVPNSNSVDWLHFLSEIPVTYLCSLDEFQLKELEKLGPKKGVITQSVKDVVQSLVDDDLASKDKIGTSVSKSFLNVV